MYQTKIVNRAFKDNLLLSSPSEKHTPQSSPSLANRAL
jgi:hypothetical protein